MKWSTVPDKKKSNCNESRDLEGVVDALKRVTEKLRAENERLRRGAAEGAGRAEAERAARESKKRAGELKEEVDRLTAKAREADDAVYRLAQKQVNDSINVEYCCVLRPPCDTAYGIFCEFYRARWS